MYVFACESVSAYVLVCVCEYVRVCECLYVRALCVPLYLSGIKPGEVGVTTRAKFSSSIFNNLLTSPTELCLNQPAQILPLPSDHSLSMTLTQSPPLCELNLPYIRTRAC